MKNARKIGALMFGALLVLASCDKAEEVETATATTHNKMKSEQAHMISASVDTLDFGFFPFGSREAVTKEVTITNISNQRIRGFYTRLNMPATTNGVQLSAPIPVGGSKVAYITYKPSTFKPGVVTGELILNANLEDEFSIPTIATVGER